MSADVKDDACEGMLQKSASSIADGAPMGMTR